MPSHMHCVVYCHMLPMGQGGVGKGALRKREMGGGGSGNHPFSELCPSFQLLTGAGLAPSRTLSDTSTVLCEKVGHGLILERVTAI